MQKNLTFSQSLISSEDRIRLYLKHAGCTVWLTGLSASGKSTVSCLLEKQLLEEGFMACRLDGDNIRMDLNSDLGFLPEDRKENIRRIAHVATLMSDAGIITLVSFISPYAADREKAKAIHQSSDIPFFEVYISTPLEICEQRDPKGLYEKARKGIIKNFTGISAPYQAPTNPDFTLNTQNKSLEELETHLENELLPLLLKTVNTKHKI